MNKTNYLLLLGLALLFLSIGLYSAFQNDGQPKRILPTFGQTMKDTLVAGQDTVWKATHRVPDFSFTNQASEPVTEEDLAGSIYVSDFFFTSCQGICPMLTSTMVEVYVEYKGHPKVQFISHTVDPQTDTPEQLARYAQAHGARLPQWHFVTGEASTLYRHAREGYLIDSDKNMTDNEAFVHSQLLVLVDPDQRIRGFYDGTDPKTDKILIRDIRLLLQEYGYPLDPPTELAQ